MNLYAILEAIYDELETPTGQVGPLSAAYARAVQAIGHAVLGAAVFAPLGLMGLCVAVVGAIVYWIAKERGDLRRGGSFWDGMEDTIMVSLGAWYGGIWWPLIMLGAGGYIMAVAAWRAVK